MSHKFSRRRFMKLSAAAAMAAATFSLTGCDSSSLTPTAPVPPFGKTQTIAGGVEVNFKTTQLYGGKYQAFVDVTIPSDYFASASDYVCIKTSDFSAKLDGKELESSQYKVTLGPNPWSSISDTGLRTYNNTGTRQFRIEVTAPAGASKLQVSYTFKHGDVEETATAEGDIGEDKKL